MFCKYCGQEVNPNSKYCIKCGNTCKVYNYDENVGTDNNMSTYNHRASSIGDTINIDVNGNMDKSGISVENTTVEYREFGRHAYDDAYDFNDTAEFNGDIISSEGVEGMDLYPSKKVSTPLVIALSVFGTILVLLICVLAYLLWPGSDDAERKSSYSQNAKESVLSEKYSGTSDDKDVSDEISSNEDDLAEEDSDDFNDNDDYYDEDTESEEEYEETYDKSDDDSDDYTDNTTDNNRVILYRVRKSPYDSESQVGAFEDYTNAKRVADSLKGAGYEVYDEDGNLVYKP